MSTFCTTSRARDSRRGAALMITMFMIFLVTLLVVNVLDTETVELSAVRNSIDHERALYLANAAMHHALAEIEAAPSWLGTVSSGSFPANDTYTATAVAGSGNTVSITAKGAAGGAIRTIVAAIEN